MDKKEKKDKVKVKVDTTFTNMSRNAVRKLKKAAAKRRKAKSEKRDS